MLDEFPALGRLDFFETSLAFMAGYGVRAFLVAQSLNQIDRAYGVNHAILDNCHVRVAFAPNDERTARRLSEALGTATEIRRHRNVSGSRLSAWLPHLTMSEQETPRPLLTPGEVLQLPSDEALVLVSGAPPIRARKLQYYADRNFLVRCLAAPPLSEGRFADAPPARGDDWSGRTRAPDPRLEKAWFDLVAPTSTADESPPRTREIAPRRSRQKDQRPPADLPLFTWEPADTRHRGARPAGRRGAGEGGAVPGVEALRWPRRSTRSICRCRWRASSTRWPGIATAPSRRWSRRRCGRASSRSSTPASRRASRAGSTRSAGRWQRWPAISWWPPRPSGCSCATS